MQVGKFDMRYRVLIALIMYSVVLSACGKKEAPVVDTTVEPVKIAVTSEFLPTAELLSNKFTSDTQIAVEFTSGTDAELAQMITGGADIDVFMSSDIEHPMALIDKGKALSEGESVYALGTAALYSRHWKLNWNAVSYLESGQFNSLSVPNADNRYGQAGIAFLEDVGVYENVKDKIIYTESEAESLELVNTKAADAGFIEFSSISDAEKRWAWIVPQDIYQPIEMRAVLIKNEPMNDASKIWMGFLGSDSARSIIRQSGYGVIERSEASSSN